jgi:nucleoside-diphosphate-sugar epimerase
MKMLITGASGFLGGHVVEALHRGGHETIVLARRTSDLSAVNESIDEVRFGDLTDRDSIVEASKDADMVFHCAGAVKMLGPYKEIRDINVGGTFNLVRAVAESGVERIIYASSLGVHGMRRSDGLPKDKYCRSKAEAEKIFFDECSKSGIEGVALRPGVIYGPRDFNASYPMFKHAEEGKVLLIGGGNTRFPLIYIDDLVEVFLKVMEMEEASGQSFDLSGVDATQRIFFQLICKELGIEFSPVSVSCGKAMMAARMSELKFALKGYRGDVVISRFVVQLYGLDHSPDISRAKELLDFAPSTSLEEGVRKTASWYRTLGD